ncbi:MAG TPA: PilZ domain-containing protein [Termitinemataceae bacterium]|uniref:PilZ domain-containing protein n=1 Tax=Treponema sp. J25 TaxID=2094121 RepID=UPI001051F8B3|nr:PilZ domain-containing protein [Treponema sp. J25]TCW60058.1 pilus assembly protein PilZ [Treponema sp. J25]HOK00238.1 PilZ domain-containing protein [Termitinemataceae bacterium]HOM24462.1 PilZ domain-containing protein [Termitinemataceae bacterium]HPQ01563.1 PilZ domain-containing protein [Termitinemataceae bacterium]
MKLLIVIGADEVYTLLHTSLKPLGCELIRYRHPLKAMDNIDEVDPEGIIISAEDFPRHWKTLVQFIRSERPKEKTPIILLKGPRFSFEEAAKASYLGVSGIVSEDLTNPEEMDRLESILGRYLPFEESRRTRRIRPEPWDQFGLIFSHPRRGILITGSIQTISINALSFLPQREALVSDIPLDTPIPLCTLRVGEQFLHPICKLVRTGRILVLQFESFPEGEQEILEQYLQERPFREQKYREGEKISST